MASNKIMNEQRVVTGFDKIKLVDYGKVTIVQGQEESLLIEADPDLFPDIRSKVVNETLTLSLKQDFVTKLISFAQSIGKNPILYRISLKQLKELSISGKFEVEAGQLTTDSLLLRSTGIGKIQLKSLQADLLNLKISGRSEINAAGRVKEINVGVSGSGEFHAEELVSQFVSVSISGQGIANVWAEDLLDVNISGHGRVNYKGSPKISQRISGSGSVNQMGE